MCIFVTMPYKDPANQRECLRQWKLKNKERVKELDKRWRDDNRERVNAQRMQRWRERKNKEKGDGGLRVVLTPLTGAESPSTSKKERGESEGSEKKMAGAKQGESAGTEKGMEESEPGESEGREKKMAGAKPGESAGTQH